MTGSSAKDAIKIVPYGSQYYWQSVNLRSEILRIPLGLEFTDDQWEKERDALHFVYLEDAIIKASLVLKPVTPEIMEMKQVAVHEEVQKTGIGTRLVLFSEAYALEKGYRIMECHARKVAVDFYKKLSYTIKSDEFIEVTIPHYKMAKRLVDSCSR